MNIKIAGKAIEKLSLYLKTALDIVILEHPLKTALGVLFGLGIHVLVMIFNPIIIKIKFMNINTIENWQFIILGFFIVYIPSILSLMMLNKPKLDENTEKALKTIRLAKKSGVPEWQIKQMYLRLCEKVVEKVTLKKETTEEIKEMEKLLKDSKD